MSGILAFSGQRAVLLRIQRNHRVVLVAQQYSLKDMEVMHLNYFEGLSCERKVPSVRGN